MSAPVAVLGGGAWGTALALVARRAGNDVRLWARDARTVAEINVGRQNARYLGGASLDVTIDATTDPARALAGAGTVLAAIPAQALRSALSLVAPAMPPKATLVLCAKGIEVASGRLLSEVVAEVLPGRSVAALSGPSFASDVVRGLPTAVVVAHPSRATAGRLASKLTGPGFRCYSTDDLVGVEVGGALKNVFAIAAGAVAGAGLGASAQAALVTRGFVELRRFAMSYGAQPQTVMGLSGLGDLMLTCSSAQSRNFAYGVALGGGGSRDGLPLAEGVATASIAARIARSRRIDAPIVRATDQLLRGETSVAQAVETLMSRPLKAEDAP
ncbi:MAG: NAD(P)H-dependent glycerol-3-phosphate dehydrogenase [Rhizobiaceae bacterium]